MSTVAYDQRVALVRQFNRFYTQEIGALNESLLESSFTLAEARVLYELAHRGSSIACELCAELDLDAGYLSRILRAFQRDGLIERKRAATDHRRNHLNLTAVGRKAFAQLDARSRESIGAMLEKLPEHGQSRLVMVMQTIGRLLTPEPATGPAYRLRAHQPGDIGWVISRHGAVYAEECGFDERFEALVAEIAANFIKNFDTHGERCWIAEMRGEPVGSVFLVKHSERIAQLRLLLVEPVARGLGIGHRLVDECVRFAREADYEKLTLWTQSALLAARHIYEGAGFRMVYQEPHHSFGYDLIGDWELVL